MYNQGQMQEWMKQEQEKRKQYDENSIAKARTKWQDAREHLWDLQQNNCRDQDALYQAREAEATLKKELEEAIRYSSHLVEQKRLQDLSDEREAEHKKAQQENAAQEKSAYLAQLKERWLANGGSEHSYNENKEPMWTEEVKRRVTSYQSPVEQLTEQLRKSGRYGGL